MQIRTFLPASKPPLRISLVLFGIFAFGFVTEADEPLPFALDSVGFAATLVAFLSDLPMVGRRERRKEANGVCAEVFRLEAPAFRRLKAKVLDTFYSSPEYVWAIVSDFMAHFGPERYFSSDEG